MTQKSLIVDYLQQHGTLTRWEAFRELGIAELSSRIGELQREGFEIPRETIDVYARNGKKVKVTEYRTPTKWP